MTIELIRQARERLETLRAESTPGEWLQIAWNDTGESLNIQSFETGEMVAELGTETDAWLVVTLHRTINAQLKILECGLDDNADVMCVDHAELLAKAIMGVE